MVWALQIPQALKVARAAQIGSLRRLPNVRIVAIRGGVVVLASNGCFRMTGRRGESFVSEVLPLLCGTENPATSSLDWMDAFGKQLLDLDLVTVSAEAAPAFDHHNDEFRVAVIRHTLQMVRVTEHLSALGIKCVGSAADNMLIIADFSGLDADRSLQLARDVHDTGCRSITFWRHGVETFYGPLCDPRRTACWNCCRLRFSDSISRDTNTTEGDELASAKVITDNVVLALRYPDVAAFGCVVVAVAVLVQFIQWYLFPGVRSATSGRHRLTRASFLPFTRNMSLKICVSSPIHEAVSCVECSFR